MTESSTEEPTPVVCVSFSAASFAQQRQNIELLSLPVICPANFAAVEPFFVAHFRIRPVVKHSPHLPCATGSHGAVQRSGPGLDQTNDGSRLRRRVPTIRTKAPERRRFFARTWAPAYSNRSAIFWRYAAVAKRSGVSPA